MQGVFPRAQSRYTAGAGITASPRGGPDMMSTVVRRQKPPHAQSGGTLVTFAVSLGKRRNG